LSKIENKDSKISSFLTIQEGCDKFCHFCVVPYTRGPEYSRPFDQIINEAKEIIQGGAKEIILLGQNVNAYNYKHDNKEFRLSDLLLELESFNELERIRYTTSHPKDMTDDLIDVYRKSTKLMPLVHLPVQSGSNKILKLMNRKHTIEEYLKIYEKLKNINSNIEFSSDFIIGYPEESDDDFMHTMELIEKINFINSYSFIYSPRPGTVAADLEPVDKKKSKERLEIIQKKLFANQINKNKSLEGKILNVLVENKMKDRIKLFGRTEYMTSVIFDGSTDCIGKVVQVEITSSNQNSLFGILKENYKQKVA
jgi:tRNA-2-methylthio-N6-dimethylallyladenosine synthase